MSLSDIYTLGVRIQGDVSSLRAELTAAQGLANDFAKNASEALNRAAGAMERSAQAMESSARRSGKATDQTGRSAKKTGDAFDEYMKRAKKANDEVARSSEQSSERTTQSLGGIGRTLGRLTGAVGLGMLGKQVWDIGKGFHEFTQNTQVALELFLGSQDAAKGFLADVLEFAKRTPYAFTDLTDQAKQLLTYGFQAEQIIPILQAVGDAATGMGTGVVGMERITRALGQINTKGRLQSQELLQLSEAGVNGLAILANQAGMTTIEYQKLIEKGMIPASVAIEGLTKGILEGTDGINGQTTAFGGLMERIKGSGGITATLDATRTSVRNTSAAVTESLMPAFLNMLRSTQNVLGVVEGTARAFNQLPDPVRNAGIAFGVAAVAARLLNAQGRATGVWIAFRTALMTARIQADVMTSTLGRTRGMMMLTRTAVGALAGAARTAGAALMTAFGGPVGLAIAGAVAGITAWSTASNEAHQKATDLADTMDRVTGALTEQSTEWVKNELLKKQNFGIGNTQSMVEMAEKMGASVEVLTRAYLGEAEAIEELRRLSQEYLSDASLGEQITLGRASEVDRFNRNLDDQARRLDEARKITEAKRQVDEAGTEALRDQGDALQDANKYLREFTEEQTKAIEKAQENATKALSVNFGSLTLNIATEEDVAQARDKVEQATRRLRDAEQARQEIGKREKVTAQDKVRAEESVADARKALEEATNSLAQTEERTDPVKQYKDKVNGILEANETFLADIQTLADRGLNATDLQEIINAGAEGSLDVRKALLGDQDMVEFANQAREVLTEQAETIAAQASVVEQHLQDTGGELMGDLALGMKIAAAENTAGTLQELADKLGESPNKIRQVGNQLGLEFVNGFSDALGFDVSLFFGERKGTPGGGGRGPLMYSQGGIFPGYTPGRDVGFIGVSGGEAIMRPEWTRAVGPDLVHRWNRIARTSGVDGVRAEMRRFLGGFANGGVVGAPQVVTVPVSVTNEKHTPWTIQNAYFTDPNAATQAMDRARARASYAGRAHE